MPTFDDFLNLRANTLYVPVDGSAVKYKGSSVKGCILYKAKESGGNRDTYSNYDKGIGISSDGSVTGAKTGLTYAVAEDAHIFFPLTGRYANQALGDTSYGYFLSSTYFGKTGTKADDYVDNVSGVYTLRVAASSINHQVGVIGYFGFPVRAVKVTD